MIENSIKITDTQNSLNAKLWKKCGEFLTPLTTALQSGGFSRRDYDSLDSKVIRRILKPNMKIADVGCYTGTSTSILAGATKNLNSKVYAIDWFQGSENSNLDNCKKYINYYQILKDNLDNLELNNVEILEMQSKEASKQFDDESLDLVFIDADHRYSYIKEDLELWYPKVKKNGILCGHDYEYKAVHYGFPQLPENIDDIDYINELHLHPGVLKAVYEKFNYYVHAEVDSIWWVQK